MSSQDPELAGLFNAAIASVKAEQKAKAVAKLKKTAEPQLVSTQSLYLDPDNWERTRGVALIHEETDTILGNFSEYLHRSVPGCRKLVREEAPIAVSTTERVAGNWWLGEERRPEPKQVWHEQRTAILHIYLDKLQVHSPACEVVAHLSYGSLARVELVLDTQFAQADDLPAAMLFLPAGANIIEVMSRDCKVALMQELGK